MSWFGKDKKPIQDKTFFRPTYGLENPIEKPDTSDNTYFKTVIMSMVNVEKQKIIDTQADVLATMVEQLKTRVQGYDFSCRRYGDFLTIFIDYGSPPDQPYINNKASFTINLGLVKSIRMIAGRAPSLDGETHYTLRRTDRRNNTRVSFPVNMVQESLKAPDDNEYDVITVDDITQSYLPDFYSRNKSNPYLRLNVFTANTPLDGMDDRIVFEGISNEIHIPFGVGSQVELIILQQLERGYEPRDLPKTIQT